MKVLNLYAGIGGNRKLWDNVEVTAVELDPIIAGIYQDFFPEDTVIIGDAHKYLEDNYLEFDFIWASPPCPSHSKIRAELGVGSGQNKAIFPKMMLYEEIIFLDYYFKGQYCVENVVSYYDPLVRPQLVGNHYLWANFLITEYRTKSRNHHGTINGLEDRKGFDLSNYTGIDKRKILRNCVEPELGKHVLKCSRGNTQQSLTAFSKRLRISE